MILGIDEAGRGPVIGPLVLCGVHVTRAQEEALGQLGVRDSKSFGSSDAARRRRRALAQKIREAAARVTLLVVDAAEVDRRVCRGQLNQLEQELARVIIDAGPAAARIVADGQRLFGPLAAYYPQLDALDRADATEPVVAAASILAKVERDEQFARIVAPYQDELGPIRGGGYANPGTESFLRAYADRNGDLPPEVRHSWSWAILEQLPGHDPPSPDPRPEQLQLAGAAMSAGDNQKEIE